MTTGATRRDRQRAETVAEIKERAWSLMASVGPDALSLREVARQMGMAPSAMYRYFPSRNDLLTELIIDAFDSLTDAVREAARLAAGGPPLEAFVETCRSYRAWAMTHRTQWALVFSTSIPDYNGTEQTKAASMRVTDILIAIMADAVTADEIDVEAIDATIDDSLRPGLQMWSEHGGLDLPPGALAAAMWCYAMLHGCLALDINEHLPPPLLDNEALFVGSIRAILAQVSR